MKTFAHIVLPFAILIVALSVSAQEQKQLKEGEVSYKSPNNVYVTFESTEGLTEGDTLFMSKNENLVPVLVVKNLSSISCVCDPLPGFDLEVGDRIFGSKSSTGAAAKDVTKGKKEFTDRKDAKREKQERDAGSREKIELYQRIHGRVSVSSFSDFSNTDMENRQRMRYLLSLDADHIGGSRLSFDSYVAFSHRNNEWDEIRDNMYNGLKIYNLNLKYAFNANTKAWLGRKINPKLSSMGAIDGLQFEKGFGSFTAGIVAGSRPDWEDYSFNAKLFQAGAYINHHHKSEEGSMQTTLAFVEQTNKGNTDRRFVYVQHVNMLVKKLYFFGSGEFDLYKQVDGQQESVFNLTNLYLSLRYRMLKKLSVSFSYSARNNIIYYETYKSFVERLLEMETLQGFILSANYRPFKFVSVGARAGYRDRKSDDNPSKNLYAYMSFSKLPFLGLSANINTILLETSYLKGQVYGARLYRDFMKGKINTSAGYRNVNYTYFNNELETNQHIIEASVSLRTAWQIFLSLNYEATVDEAFTFHRLYVNLTKRF